MEQQNIHTTCFYCNTRLQTDLDAYVILSIGGHSATDVANLSDRNEKFVEANRAKLCSCPLCKRREKIISEDVLWLSLNEVIDAIKDGKIISNNPEIELLFKMIEITLMNKMEIK